MRIVDRVFKTIVSLKLTFIFTNISPLVKELLLFFSESRRWISLIRTFIISPYEVLNWVKLCQSIENGIELLYTQPRIHTVIILARNCNNQEIKSSSNS